MDSGITHNIDINIGFLKDEETENEVLEAVIKASAIYIKEAELKETAKQMEKAFIASRQSSTNSTGNILNSNTTNSTSPSVSTENSPSEIAPTISNRTQASSNSNQSVTSNTTTPVEGGNTGIVIPSESERSRDTNNEVLPPATATTSQIYTGTKTQQLTVPQELQGNADSKPTLEEVKMYVATQLEGAEEGSQTKKYWQMLSNELNTITKDDEIEAILNKDKEEGYGAGFKLFSDWYMTQNKENSHDWKSLKTALIEKIKTHVLTTEAQKDAKMKAHWDGIITKLENPSIDISQLFVDHEELFLVLRQLKDFESLPEKITIKTSTKVYPDISVSSIYAAIGVKDIYTFLQRFPDETGKGVLKISIDVEGLVTKFEKGTIPFKASNFSSKKGDKSKINWLVYDASGTIITKYIDQGSTLTHTFTAYGDYIVEAYGNKPTNPIPTLKQAEESSKVKLKNGKRKNYMALTIKEPELIGIQPNEAKEYVLGEKAKTEALFDVSADSYPSIIWNHYVKTLEDEKYTKTTLKGYAGKKEITDFDFGVKGYHYIEVVFGGTKKYFGSAEEPIKVGGSYITAIAETKHKKPFVLYNTNTSLCFTPTKYKIGKGEDIPKETITWSVLKDGKSTGFTSTGKTLKIDNTTTYAEGNYTVKVCVDDPILGKKYAKKDIKIIQPQVTDAYWADSNGQIKLTSGYRNVDNYIYANIPYFNEQEICISICHGNKELYVYDARTDKEGKLKYQICFDDMNLESLFSRGIKENILRAEIKGIGYQLKSTQPDILRRLENLKIYKDEKITEAYFMFNGQIISPVTHVVPYEEKVSFVAETTNMVGQTLDLKLYQSKSLTDRNGTYVINHSATVNSDGKIVIPFTLESKWMGNDNTKPYFYVHIEKDMPWWSSDIEKNSVTLRAYCEGDAIDGVEILGYTVYPLGALSEKWESGGKGPGTVSTGKGDPGGVSYGVYQLSSKRGSLINFLKNEGKEWAKELEKYDPGSKEFNSKWKEIAKKEESKFREAQHKFIKNKYYEPFIKRVKRQINLDVNSYSFVLKDVLWSTAVQHGPANNIFKNALLGKDLNLISEKDIITEIYNERGKLKSNGTLKYFSKVSPDWIPGLQSRFKEEKLLALELLKK